MLIFNVLLLQLREVQNGELAKIVASGDSQNAENLVFKVLEQRHMRERAEQEEQFARELEISRVELRATFDENRQAQREALIATQEEVLKLETFPSASQRNAALKPAF